MYTDRDTWTGHVTDACIETETRGQGHVTDACIETETRGQVMSLMHV